MIAGSATIAGITSSCAAGGDLPTTTSSSSGSSSSSGVGGTGGTGGTSSSSASSSSGTGGTGGTSSSSSSSASSSGTGGTGGTGGASSSSSSSSSGIGGTGGTGGGGGADAGVTGTIVLLAGGGANLLTGEFQEPGAQWSTGTLADTTDDALAVVMTDSANAVGILRSKTNAELRATLWSGGSWSLPAVIGAGVTTRAAPSIAHGSGSLAGASFHGNDFKHYFAAHVASWNPTAEAVGGMANQSFGPSPAAIIGSGSDMIVAFAGNNHDLYDQDRSGGAWGAGHPHGLGDALVLTPSIIIPTSGPDRMIVYVRNSDARIVYTTRTANVWTAPAVIDQNALTNDPVALLALPSGGALVAYRGQNQGLYFSRYTPGAVPPWTVPAAVAGAITVPSPPSLAAGVGGTDAEIAFVTGGAAKHARLTGMSWSAPVTVGGAGLTHVAIASSP